LAVPLKDEKEQQLNQPENGLLKIVSIGSTRLPSRTRREALLTTDMQMAARPVVVFSTTVGEKKSRKNPRVSSPREIKSNNVRTLTPRRHHNDIQDVPLLQTKKTGGFFSQPLCVRLCFLEKCAVVPGTTVVRTRPTNTRK